MVVNEYINVPNDRLMDGLIPVVNIMFKASSSDDPNLDIDFSHTQFITPVFALALIVYLSNCGKKVFWSNLTDYLGVIGFGSGGIRPDRMRSSEFVAYMESFARKTYIPIVNFPAKASSDEKDDISTIVENVIIRQLGIPSNVAQGLKYMVEETYY